MGILRELFAERPEHVSPKSARRSLSSSPSSGNAVHDLTQQFSALQHSQQPAAAPVYTFRDDFGPKPFPNASSVYQDPFYINPQTSPYYAPIQQPHQRTQSTPNRPLVYPVASQPVASTSQLKVSPSRPALDRPITDPLPRSAAASHQTPTIGSPLAKPKPNQCHGTISSGRRCTRIVALAGSTDSPKSSPSKAKGKGSPATQSSSPALTADALSQLNRMLNKRSGSKTVKDNPEEIGSDTGLDVEPLPVFCYQHTKFAMEEKGTFAGPKGVWIAFDGALNLGSDLADNLLLMRAEWIPADLPNETKLQLRHEMAKPTSADEKEGYIYVHEMARNDTAQPCRTSMYVFRKLAEEIIGTTLLKIGRSIKPVARHTQWKSQCPSRSPIVRDIFPLHPSHPLLRRQTPFQAAFNQALRLNPALVPVTNGSRLRGAVQVAERGCPFHHRLERLILIEVAGRASLQARARGTESVDAKGKCVDCGKTHCELFEVDAYA